MFILLIKLRKLACEYNKYFLWLLQTFWDKTILSRTFPDLEITILKFNDFSSFSMTVQTLPGIEEEYIEICIKKKKKKKKWSIGKLHYFFNIHFY